MKKNLTLALVLSLATTLASSASPVSLQQAKDIALTFLQQQHGAAPSLKVKGAEMLSDQIYVVNFSPAGWAMVSADDAATPIVGYNTEGSLSQWMMPENMQFMVGEYSSAIKQAAQALPTDARWAKIRRGVMSRSSEDRIEPLIQVKWDQGNPFNKYCPGEGNNKAIVGCVAVAMGQAMSVQKWPPSPSGQHAYSAPGYGRISIDYDAESPYSWDSMIAGSNNDDVARLLYHAGVSVDMGYGADGSGIPSSQVYRISNALRDYFGYGSDVTYEWRDKYTGDWEQLLINELNAGRAVIYNAVDSKNHGGHSFNICGYNGSNFYVNWGWGGYGNGYFPIDHLADESMKMCYDSNHVAVIGIGAPNSPLRNVQLSDLEIEAGLPSGATVSTLLINGELPTSEYRVELTGSSASSVPLSYQKGLIKTKQTFTEGQDGIYVRFKVTHIESGAAITQGFTLTVTKPKTIAQKTAVSYDRASGKITVHTKYDSDYVVRNAQGTEVARGQLSLFPEFTIDRSQLTTGVNTVEINNHGQSKVFNIKF